MSRREPNLEDIFMYGVLGTLGLAFIGVLVFFVIEAPISLAIALGGIFGLIATVFIVGWCIANFNNFREEFKWKKAVGEPTPVASPILHYETPALNKLAEFESKYHMSTVVFMNHVYRDYIPEGMNNLDYLEWLSLVNELPSITLDKTNAS